MKKISYENFDKLNTVEYQEYKYLKKKDFNGEILGIFLTVLFHLAVSSIVALSFSKRDDQIAVFLICIFLPYCWIPTVVIAGFLEEFYKKIYRYSFNNQNAYIKFKEFEKKYPPIEKEIKSQLRNYVDFHLIGLIRQLRKNISNQQGHKDLIETFKLNHWFVEDASELLGISIYETKYKGILRKEDVWFEDDLLKIKEREEPKKNS